MRTDVTKKLQDLRHLDWAERVASSGTAGCFLKAREATGGGVWYCKLSCYDGYRGIYGHECVNELVASRLMDILGIEHVSYRLVHALVRIDGCDYETWLARSRSFRKSGEQKLAFDTFYDLNKHPGETPIDLCARFGWLDQIQKTMLVDYLIANRDRHGANIEILRDRQGALRMAPVFDSGLSFVFSCYGDEDRVCRFDPLEDVNANNYLGTRSLEENVRRFVPAGIDVRPLEEHHREKLLFGLEDALSSTHLSKIWDILRERWHCFEALRNS